MKTRIVIWVQNGCKCILDCGGLAGRLGAVACCHCPGSQENVIPHIAGLRKSENLKEGFYLTSVGFPPS